MKNSKTYRSQTVQQVDVSQMLSGRDGQAAVVGVDVGKEKLYLVVRWSDGQTHRPVVVLQPEEIDLALTRIIHGAAA
ncbi:MAG: hypothetical protein M0Z50_11550 [Planctomycetia bacterium]|nr:hypothetical protein [Planctomycetia bacterium]